LEIDLGRSRQKYRVSLPAELELEAVSRALELGSETPALALGPEPPLALGSELVLGSELALEPPLQAGRATEIDLLLLQRQVQLVPVELVLVLAQAQLVPVQV